MATATEIQSLEEIQYKSKFKLILLILLVFVLFVTAFLNFYPIGDKIKVHMQRFMSPGCNPDFDDIRVEWLMPKIVISNLTLPAACLNRQGEPLKFNFVNINWHLISFSPVGIPYRIDTEMAGQPLSVHYVFGINQQLIRLKDQTIHLGRLEPLMGGTVKMAGSMTVDLSVLLANNVIKDIHLKGISKDFRLPSQNIQGFVMPNLDIKQFYVEADSVNHPRVEVKAFRVGDANAPIRAEFKGRIDLQEGNVAFSRLDLKGEIAFSDYLRQGLPLVDMLFQSFTQKDGFYQVRLGGTLGAPKPMAP